MKPYYITNDIAVDPATEQRITGINLPMEMGAMIKKHIETLSCETINDIAFGKWDEAITDRLFAACGAATREEMIEAKNIAREIARRAESEKPDKCDKCEETKIANEIVSYIRSNFGEENNQH